MRVLVSEQVKEAVVEQQARCLKTWWGRCLPYVVGLAFWTPGAKALAQTRTSTNEVARQEASGEKATT